MRLFLLLALLLTLRPIQTEASFFMRLRGSDRRQIEALGGQAVYRTSARINGVPASLDVFGFGSAAGDVADELRRLWQLPAPATPGPAWLTRLHDGRVVHLLVLPGVRLSDSTVWMIEPRNRGPLPRGSAIPEPPGTNPFPAGELRCWIANDQTRSLFLLYRTTDAPKGALAGVTAALAAKGWQEQARTGALAMLARDGRAALAFATTASGGTEGTHLALFLQGAAPRF